MNTNARIEMVKAMELIARAINDESIFEGWLSYGVADGDADMGDEELEYYTDDDTFANLMDTFLWLMKRAYKSGGLYYDGIISKED